MGLLKPLRPNSCLSGPATLEKKNLPSSMCLHQYNTLRCALVIAHAHNPPQALKNSSKMSPCCSISRGSSLTGCAIVNAQFSLKLNKMSQSIGLMHMSLVCRILQGLKAKEREGQAQGKGWRTSHLHLRCLCQGNGARSVQQARVSAGIGATKCLFFALAHFSVGCTCVYLLSSTLHADDSPTGLPGPDTLSAADNLAMCRQWIWPSPQTRRRQQAMPSAWWWLGGRTTSAGSSPAWQPLRPVAASLTSSARISQRRAYRQCPPGPLELFCWVRHLTVGW